MSKILLVTSSPRGAASHSSRVARSLVERLAHRSAGVAHRSAGLAQGSTGSASADSRSSIVVRDLTKQPLNHIGEDFVTALATPPERRTQEQSAAIALSDQLIAELFDADVIVIASAMINFGVSSNLKTYIDHLLRAGSTFRYTANGPEGLVKGKKAFIVRASGGVYSDGPARAANFQDTYLKHVLGFIGITDVEVIHIEGVAFGPEATEKALAAAAGKVSAVRPCEELALA
jgi:FMN-dependent NADH-azoreductase